MEFKLNRGGTPQLPPHAPLLLMVPGAGLALLGVLLIYEPALIAYIVGGILVLLGGLLLFAGVRARRMLG